MATKKANGSGPKVLVRAYSGVFFGTLLERRGSGESCEVDLADVRHVWQWTSTGLPRKVLTLEDMALIGAGTGTKVSGVAPKLTVLDVKLIVETTAEGARVLEGLPCLA